MTNELKEFRDSLKSEAVDAELGSDPDIKAADLDPTLDPYNQQLITVALKIQPMGKDGSRQVILAVRSERDYRPVRMLTLAEFGELPIPIAGELKALAEDIRARKAEESQKSVAKAPTNKNVPVASKPAPTSVTPPPLPPKKEQVVVVQQTMDDFI